MRLGCCGSLSDADSFKAAGFDFLEVNVQGVLQGGKTDAEYDAAAPDPSGLALPVEAANCLVPANLPVVGPQRDLSTLRQYMARVAARGRRLGIKRLVFGSGGARHRPEGYDPVAADAEIAEFTRLAGDACARHDILLVIEHLNQMETNTINKLAQSRALWARVAHPAVEVLVDSYHYGLESEPDSAIPSLGRSIRHVHVAEVVDRIQPGGHAADHPEKSFDFVRFFRLLRQVGYNERVAVEAKWQRPVSQIGPQVIAFLKQAWDKAGKA